MLIMNEVKEAERIINKNIEGCSPGVAIGVLAKYFIKKKNMNSVDTKVKINSCLIANWPCINLFEWNERIDKAIKNAKKFPLKEINEIFITQNEVDVIKSIPIKRQQRLAFTLLVIAKFNYEVSGHEWVNNSINEINRVAGVKWNDMKSKRNDIHELYLRKLIVFPRRVDSTSIKVLYLDKDNSSDVVIKVKSFEKVGSIWAEYNNTKYNNNNYKHCIDCGIPFEVSGKSRRRKTRCDECQKAYRLKYKADKEKEYRQA